MSEVKVGEFTREAQEAIFDGLRAAVVEVSHRNAMLDGEVAALKRKLNDANKHLSEWRAVAIETSKEAERLMATANVASDKYRAALDDAGLPIPESATMSMKEAEARAEKAGRFSRLNP
jgi:hypothetical protein